MTGNPLFQMDPQDQAKYSFISGMVMFVICVLIAVTFMVLKLTGVIAWGWLWVFAPIWIPMAIGNIVWCETAGHIT